MGKFGCCKSNESGHFGKWCLVVFINILEATSSRSYSWIPLAEASSSETWIYQSYQFWIYAIVPNSLRSVLDPQCVIFPDVQAYKFQALALFYCCYVSLCSLSQEFLHINSHFQPDTSSAS